MAWKVLLFLVTLAIFHTVNAESGTKSRSESQLIPRAALPVPPSSDSPVPGRYARPPVPPHDRGRGRGRYRGQSPSPGPDSPRARQYQLPQTYYTGPRTPSGSIFREQSPIGTEGSVHGGLAAHGGSREPSPGLDHAQYPPLPQAHGGSREPSPGLDHARYPPLPQARGGSREPSPGLDYAQYPPVPQARGGSREPSPGLDYAQYHPVPQAHGSASIPNIPHGGLPPGFRPQYDAGDHVVPELNVPSHGSPGHQILTLFGVGPIAQGLHGIPGVPNSGPQPARSNDQRSQGISGSPSPGASRGNSPGTAQTGSQPSPGTSPGSSPQGSVAPPPGVGQLPPGVVYRPSYSVAMGRGQAPPPPPVQGVRTGLPGVLWVPHSGNDGGGDGGSRNSGGGNIGGVN